MSLEPRFGALTALPPDRTAKHGVAGAALALSAPRPDTSVRE